MIRHVSQLIWDDALQDYRPCPLDDADKWTIELARRVNGRNLTDREVEQAMAEAWAPLTSRNL